MNGNEWDIRVVCRLDGHKPTARDRWVAFYRLWRMMQRQSSQQGVAGAVHRDTAACDCFSILMPDPTFLLLVNANGPSIAGRKDVPKFIRRMFVETERRRRLHGKFYQFLDRSKLVSRQLHERGIEITPDEVAEVRVKVLRLVRERAAASGISVPSDDQRLSEWLECWRND